MNAPIFVTRISVFRHVSRVGVFNMTCAPFSGIMAPYPSKSMEVSILPSVEPANTQRSESTVYLVTGATGAIGKAIARQLAAKPNAEVILVCRNPSKAAQSVAEITEASGNPKVRFEQADLSRPRV